MRLSPRPTARDGFTLVELLVAMALIIFLMTILSVAFSVSLDTFRTLKAIGDMSEQLRSTSTLLRRDLAADHLNDEADNGVRVSNPSLPVPWAGSKKGFFYIRQGSAGVQEGTSDADGIQSWRATDHEIGMTVKLTGKSPSDTFTGNTTLLTLNPANLGGVNLVDLATTPQQLVTQWAEVYYFLRPTSLRTSEANGTTLQLYTLYRRQRVLTPNTVVLPNTGGNAIQFNPDVMQSSSVSLAQVPLPPMPVQPPQFMAVGPESLNTFVPTNPVSNVAIPANRLGGWYDPLRPGYPGPFPAAPPHTGPVPPTPADSWQLYKIPNTDTANYGSDVVLNNVLSMRIQVQYTVGGQYLDLPANLGGTGGAFPRVYDSARVPTTGTNPQIRGMRIQLRVYNGNSSLTRQTSIVQDL